MLDALLFDLEVFRADLARYDETMRLYFPAMHSYRMNRGAALVEAGFLIVNGERQEAQKVMEQARKVLERGSLPGFSMPRTFAARLGELITRLHDLALHDLDA